MKVLIIEDEQPAAKRLTKLVLDCQPDAEVLETIDSVEAAVDWLTTFSAPDLIFMDIQLADGLSFDIFTKTEIRSPVIFTTAYDQYTLKAFKVNSIDYLLKPIDQLELRAALQKFAQLYQKEVVYDKAAIIDLIASMTHRSYKERFLVKVGQQLHYIAVKDVAYFYSQNGLVRAQLNTGKGHVLDYTLDQIDTLVDSDQFFRINRKMVIQIDAIHKIHTYFNSRLKLELIPNTSLDAIVSRDRVPDFKQWLDK